MATRVPASMSVFAIEYPIPLLPPVTKAVAFCKFMSSPFSYLARFLFQFFQFCSLSHCDENVAGLNAQVCSRIEFHDAVVPLDGENNNAIFASKPQLFERIRNKAA